jgi:HNH endonuclease
MERALQELVWQRAGGRCEYCQIEQASDRLPFAIEHIVARVHGGRDVPGNLALACFACNNHKGTNLTGIDPKTRRLTRLFNPRRHAWGRHFRWEGPVLVGLTAIGRTTVRVLAVNREYRIAFRQELIDEGLFPPVA